MSVKLINAVVHQTILFAQRKHLKVMTYRGAEQRDSTRQREIRSAQILEHNGADEFVAVGCCSSLLLAFRKDQSEITPCENAVVSSIRTTLLSCAVMEVLHMDR